jgi:hypothetical protein
MSTAPCRAVPAFGLAGGRGSIGLARSAPRSVAYVAWGCAEAGQGQAEAGVTRCQSRGGKGARPVAFARRAPPRLRVRRSRPMTCVIGSDAWNWKAEAAA